MVNPNATRRKRNLRSISKHGPRRKTSENQQLTPPSPTCKTIAQTTMFIAADSDFVADAQAECDICNNFKTTANNAETAAIMAIQEVFSAMQELYLRELCINVTLMGYDIRTDPFNDPYRNLRQASNGGPCDTYGLLRGLTSW